MARRWSELSQRDKGYPMMSDEDKAAKAAEREDAKTAKAVEEQAAEDRQAKIDNPDLAFGREANGEFGGEGFGYGSPAPGAGPDKV